MRVNTLRVLATPMLVAGVLALTACGDASPQGDQGAAAETRAAAAPAAPGEPGPPASYTPYHCSKCSCRVFGGHGAYCSRPSCKHHWKDHQRPPQGG